MADRHPFGRGRGRAGRRRGLTARTAGRLVQPRDSSRVADHPDPPEEGPVRTCVGCRGRGSRSVLVRVAVVDGAAVVDTAKTLPGRGAWLHPGTACLELALKRRTIGRALRSPDVDLSGLVVR
ncbi:YlxR family protein [Demequina sp. NBRC 110054]|uniref:YlxR family protein n=1 Tax=Demequina sp. NBRC 110054 TaxID=1570343 RepID=UPI0027D80998|nr:YlxR family protein [Demequina sp. NBRC 110054]